MAVRLSRLVSLQKRPTAAQVLESLRNRVTKSVSKSKITPDFLKSWEIADTFLHLSLPLSREDGSKFAVEVFYSSYRTLPGPVYVQVSYDSEATSESVEIRALSLGLTFGCAEVSLANGCAVVKEEETELSPSDRKRIGVLLSSEISTLCGAQVALSQDIPWLTQAKALGMHAVLENVRYMSKVKERGLDLSRSTVVFSLFSQRQSALLKLLSNDGIVPIAALDESGGTINKEGLDAAALVSHYDTHKTVKGFDGGTTFSSTSKLKTLETDWVIAESGFPDLLPKCKVLAESEFFFLSPAAEQRLKLADTLILPSYLCNVGEVAAALATEVVRSRKVPESLYSQWTTWLGIKQLMCLESLVGGMVGRDMSKELRLKATIECIASTTAFHVSWYHKQSNNDLRASAIATALNYLFRLREK